MDMRCLLTRALADVNHSACVEVIIWQDFKKIPSMFLSLML